MTQSPDDQTRVMWPDGVERTEWSASCTQVAGKLNDLLESLGLSPPPSLVATGTSPSRSPPAKKGPSPPPSPPSPEPPREGATTNAKATTTTTTTRRDQTLAALEARVASQSSAIAALRRTVRERDDAMGGLQASVTRLKGELRAKQDALDAAEQQVARRGSDDAGALARAHEEALASAVASHERKIKELKDKSAGQSMRNQQLVEKTRKLAAENERDERERRSLAEAQTQTSQQLDQLKVRLRTYRDRYAEEAKKCADQADALAKCKSKLEAATKSERDLRGKLTSMGKDLAGAKATLSKETSLRKRTHHQCAALAEDKARLESGLGSLRKRFQLHEAQRDKMAKVIAHLKDINKELMSVLLEERAANDQSLPMDDKDNPSLLPQALRLAKEEKWQDQALSGSREEDRGEDEDEGEPGTDADQDEGQGKDFYKSLKEKYQEAKATYRSLLAKDT